MIRGTIRGQQGFMALAVNEQITCHCKQCDSILYLRPGSEKQFRVDREIWARWFFEGFPALLTV